MSDIVSKSSRTSTKTVNGVQTTIVETTITRADGTTETTREETSGGGSSSGGSGFGGSGFGGSGFDDSAFGGSGFGGSGFGGSGFGGSGFGGDGFPDSFNDFGGGSEDTGTKDIEDGTERMRLNDRGFGGDSAPGHKPSSKPAGPVDVDVDTFRKQALKAHNEKRALHQVGPMKLSDELNKYAQDWAEKLINEGRFGHSNCNGGKYGENICTKWSMPPGDYTGEEATQQWYDEEPKHNYKGDSQHGSGHFSQVVWKGSTELGMGKAKDGKGKVIVVGSYFPAGNFMGRFRENVFPPKK